MKCPTPVSVKDESKSVNGEYRMIDVPCGKCGICRKNRRADWSFRLKEEQHSSLNSFFLTLTYTDNEIPETLSPEGEILGTLRRKDLTLFIKRVRKAQGTRDKFKNKLRYYAVGEYGTETNRPHYHIIFFNLDPNLLRVLERRYWKMGYIHVGMVEPASIHYITKYHVNYLKDETDPRENEFATMSRRPGIGYSYVERASTWHLENGNVYVMNNGYRQRLPRYYREKIFSENARKGQGRMKEIEAVKRYKKEYKRLKDLDIEDPDRYIFESGIELSQRIKHKGNEGNTF